MDEAKQLFDDRELNLIGGMCVAEMDFLRALETRGIPTAIQQAEVTALRAKVAQELDRRAKAALAKKKAEEEKAKHGEEKA